MFSSPCPYSSFSDYNWSSTDQREPPPGCSTLVWNPVVFLLASSFQICTIFIGGDIHVQLFYRFRKKKTLYFWSMMIATWGTLSYSAAVLTTLLGNVPMAATILSNAGWIIMTTGFQFVLYSRLHLVNPGPKVLRTVLICIIVNAMLFHGIIIILAGVATVHPEAILERVFEAFSFTEIVFTVQEMVITTLYVYYFIQQTVETQGEPDTKRTLKLLIAAEVVVFVTDVILNLLLYKWRFLPRNMIQPFCTALKLKIEFVVLNSLVDYSKSISRSTALPRWDN
ncbi:hypothetical protein EJ08DRAFT_522801 [Tothia fuscella]|uniref:DUF7703 domain-containing protein n=1 Tax=Tothia fuscella TaxID=1048955 RepID=A0A9P4NH59_9PEZI|nr:hypothetical protein EJ08DRAFT_522801 [Tothia fuscella]